MATPVWAFEHFFCLEGILSRTKHPVEFTGSEKDIHSSLQSKVLYIGLDRFQGHVINIIVHMFISPPKYVIIPLPSIYLSWNDFPHSVLKGHFFR